MKNYFALVPIIALTACATGDKIGGSGEGAPNSGNANLPDPVEATAAISASDNVISPGANGGTTFRGGAVRLEADYLSNTTRRAPVRGYRATIIGTSSNDFEITFSASGITHRFTEDDIVSDRSGVSYFDGGSGVGFFIRGNTIDDILNGNGRYNYVIPFFGFVTEGDQFSESTDLLYDVMGFETPYSVVADLDQSVTYLGFLQLSRWYTSFTDYDAAAAGDIFDLTLNVDFGANTVSGDLEGGMTFVPTTIERNGFETTLGGVEGSGTGGEGLFIEDSIVTGTFFGPNAEEVGGTISFTLSEDGVSNAQVGGGTFVGVR